MVAGAYCYIINGGISVILGSVDSYGILLWGVLRFRE